MILVHGVTINKKGGITVESILTSIKLLLGITEDYDYFDAQIITHINSVFMILTQLGVGPPEGFIINDKSNTWNEFIPDGKNLELVKSYIHSFFVHLLCVRFRCCIETPFEFINHSISAFHDNGT